MTLALTQRGGQPTSHHLDLNKIRSKGFVYIEVPMSLWDSSRKVEHVYAFAEPKTSQVYELHSFRRDGNWYGYKTWELPTKLLIERDFHGLA